MKHIRLYIFLYFTALAVLEIFYHSLDRLTRGNPGDWATSSIEQGTGVYGFMVLLPLILWSGRRCRLRSRWSCTSLFRRRLTPDTFVLLPARSFGVWFHSGSSQFSWGD